MAKRVRKKKTPTSQAITIVPGLDMPPLDEDYDRDSLAFLQEQRIYHVAIVNDCLEFKYTDGREKKFKQGIWQHWADCMI